MAMARSRRTLAQRRRASFLGRAPIDAGHPVGYTARIADPEGRGSCRPHGILRAAWFISGSSGISPRRLTPRPTWRGAVTFRANPEFASIAIQPPWNGFAQLGVDAWAR
jgi:hypothetical protein